MTFQFNTLDEQQFIHLYGLSDEALKDAGVIPYIADSKPGYPCRITLEDAEPGERLLLLNYQHLPANNPYRSAHAIFIKEGAISKTPEPNEIPQMVLCRLVSIRAFDNQDMMLDATVAEGKDSLAEITEFFSRPEVSYLHVHTAKRGCFLAEVTRN
jgi:hypothetical protein